MKDALRVEHDAGAAFLKDLVFCLGGVDIHFVLKARASALDNFDTEPMALICPCEKRPDLFRGAIRDGNISMYIG